MPVNKYTDRLLIRQIASQTGLTMSSVYKILGGSSGFSEATRTRVERIAQEMQVRLPSIPASGLLTIGVLIPERPAYFWNEAISGIRRTAQALQAERGIRVETIFRFIHFPLSESSVEATLTPLSAQSCTAYILYPIESLAFWHFFESIPANVPVVLFNDLPGDQNQRRLLQMRLHTAYVGADNYDEGMRAAHVVGARFAGVRHVLALVSEENVTTTAVHQRIEGFTQEAQRINPALSVRTEFFDVGGKLASAFLAARMETDMLNEAIDCVYVTTGVTHIVSAAIAKVRRRNCLPIGSLPLCIGHECAPSDRPYLLDGTQCGYVKQDIFSQGRSAVENLIASVLSGKELRDTFIGSSVFINGGGKQNLEEQTQGNA